MRLDKLKIIGLIGVESYTRDTMVDFGRCGKGWLSISLSKKLSLAIDGAIGRAQYNSLLSNVTDFVMVGTWLSGVRDAIR